MSTSSTNGAFPNVELALAKALKSLPGNFRNVCPLWLAFLEETAKKYGNCCYVTIANDTVWVYQHEDRLNYANRNGKAFAYVAEEECDHFAQPDEELTESYRRMTPRFLDIQKALYETAELARKHPRPTVRERGNTLRTLLDEFQIGCDYFTQWHQNFGKYRDPKEVAEDIANCLEAMAEELSAQSGRRKSRPSAPVMIMGDNYMVGQAAAVGRGAHAENISFNQIWSQSSGSIDLNALTHELEKLRATLKSRAVDADHDIALGAIAAAENSAKRGDGPAAFQYLAKAGTWVWQVANQVGVGVATAAALHCLGIT